MIATANAETITNHTQFATFYVGELLLGVSIDQVREINRHLEVTAVPHAPEHVRGVINLRGDVVTLIDLATILGVQAAEINQHSRNVIIHWEDQLVGLKVDRIADILSIPQKEIVSPPANVGAASGRFFQGVYSTDREIVVILDVEEMLSNPNLNS